MKSRKLLYNPSQILTIDTQGKNLKRGKALNDLNLVTDHSVLIEDNLIADIISNSSLRKTTYDSSLDLTL